MNFAYIFKDIFINKEYDTKTDLNNKIIFDVGGNMGIFSLWINEHFHNVKVYCFEPIKELIDIAKHNIQHNIKHHNEFIFNNFGLSDKIGEIQITHYPYSNGLSTIKED